MNKNEKKEQERKDMIKALREQSQQDYARIGFKPVKQFEPIDR